MWNERGREAAPGWAGRWRGGAVALSLVLVAAAAAACGGSPSAGVANLPSTSSTFAGHAPKGTSTAGGNSGQTAGGGGGLAGGGGPGGGGGHFSAQMAGATLAFSECMRKHNVPNFPDPNAQGEITFNSNDISPATFQAAQKACAKYSKGGGEPPSPAQQAQAVAQALKFSECMRSHGITDFPDPQVSGGGTRIAIRLGGPGSDLNPNNAQFQAAQKACQSLMPGPLSGGTKAG